MIMDIWPWTWGIPWWGWLIYVLATGGGGIAARARTGESHASRRENFIDDEMEPMNPETARFIAWSSLIGGLGACLILGGYFHYRVWGLVISTLGWLVFFSAYGETFPDDQPGDVE